MRRRCMGLGMTWGLALGSMGAADGIATAGLIVVGGLIMTVADGVVGVGKY